MKKIIFLAITLIGVLGVSAQTKTLHQLQQEFVDLRFGMFNHFSTSTFLNQDWADPDCPPEVFNPKKLDCTQWAKAAKTANMTFGCLSVKHHSGFCMWDTKTTDYNVMNSGIKRDFMKEYVDAFRAEGMEIMFHYSILDLNAKLVRNHVTLDHIEMIKEQVRELLTNYGPIKALMFDGWDAPWSRLNYDEIPFEDIYRLAKSIQPNCLVMDLNGAKYPSEGLFYSEIKTFEQGAGQKISKDKNFLPSMACYQMQKTWFWKDYMPNEPTKTAEVLVNDNLIPMNKVCCTFILNVAPNTDGLIDDNALKTLKEIGKLWKNDAPQVKVAETGEPIISKNLALGQWVEASWGLDTDIADFATDEKFYTSWRSEPRIKEPWWQVNFRDITSFNTIAITEDKDDMSQYYRIEYRLNGEWKTIFEGEAPTFRRVKIHRFDTVYGDAMRVTFLKSKGNTCVAEMGVYCERR